MLAEKKSDEIAYLEIIKNTDPDQFQEANHLSQKQEVMFTYYSIVIKDLTKEVELTRDRLKNYQALAENKPPQLFTSTN